MSMHAIIPVLFVVVVEAARHAVGRMADITADKHMESVRLMRWLLSPVPTFRLWRRMKLWEMRSYDEVVRLEQNRLVYRTHLRAQYGRNWRRQAPIETLLPLKLAKYGVPLDLEVVRALPKPVPPAAVTAAVERAAQQSAAPAPLAAPAPAQPAGFAPAPVQFAQPQPAQPHPAQPHPAQPQPGPVQPGPVRQAAVAPQPAPVLPLTGPQPDPRPVARDLLSKLAKHHRRPLHDPDDVEPAGAAEEFAGPVDNPTRGVGWLPRTEPGRVEPEESGPDGWFAARVVPEAPAAEEEPTAAPAEPTAAPAARAEFAAETVVDATVDQYFEGLCAFIDAYSYQPDEQKLAEYLFSNHGITGRGGDRPVSTATLRRHWPELQQRFAERYE